MVAAHRVRVDAQRERGSVCPICAMTEAGSLPSATRTDANVCLSGLARKFAHVFVGGLLSDSERKFGVGLDDY